jgi:hypothetical protein
MEASNAQSKAALDASIEASRLDQTRLGEHNSGRTDSGTHIA